MAMFLAELVFLFELALFSSGLLVINKAIKEKSKLTKTAGYVMVVGSLLTAACTGYYSLKYHFQGGFETVLPHKRFSHMENKDKTHHYYFEGTKIDKKDGDLYHKTPRD